MNDQNAKKDAGKLRPTLVEVEAIESMAKLEEYDADSKERKVPELLKKTQSKKGNWYGLFRCPYCGKEFEANISNVMRGRQHSCGCMKGKFAVESRGSHGDTGTRLYRIYRHILERCDNPNCKEYKWYGARGIKCEFKDYKGFKDFALSHGYNDNLTVERIDVNGNYSADNVEFIPQSLQSRNTRRSVMITYKGLTLCGAEWAELLGIRQDTITKRKRSGWSDERIIETPVKGSVDIKLVPISIIEDIRTVRKFGLTKYKDPDNWKQVEIERYRDALCRHLLAYIRDPKSVDEESGIPHYKHMACNMAFICEMEHDTWKNL